MTHKLVRSSRYIARGGEVWRKQKVFESFSRRSEQLELLEYSLNLPGALKLDERTADT